MPNEPCPLRKTRLEWESSLGNHLETTSAHGARGSPDPSLPDCIRISQKKARAAFLSKDALELFFVPD